MTNLFSNPCLGHNVSIVGWISYEPHADLLVGTLLNGGKGTSTKLSLPIPRALQTGNTKHSLKSIIV